MWLGKQRCLQSVDKRRLLCDCCCSDNVHFLSPHTLFTSFCESHSIYCHPHLIPVHLVFRFHNFPPTSTSAAFFPLPPIIFDTSPPSLQSIAWFCCLYFVLHTFLHRLFPLCTNFICHWSSFVSISHFSFWLWLRRALLHFLCLFAFSPVRLESFSFTFNSFFSLSYPYFWLHTPHQFVWSYPPYFSISLCFSFTSFRPSTITLLAPCVVGNLANSSLPGPAIWIRQLLASASCLLTGWFSCLCKLFLGFLNK